MWDSIFACAGYLASTVLIADVAKEIYRPSPSIRGFFLGFFASQFQLPVVYMHSALTHTFLLPYLGPFKSSWFIHTSRVVSYASYLLILVNFAHGFAIKNPPVRIGNRVINVKKSLRRTPLEQAAVIIERCILYIFPPLDLIGDIIRIKTYPHIRYVESEDINLHLDIIKLKRLEKRTNMPVMLFVHGGAWMYGSKKWGRFFCNTAVKAGWIVVSVDYRLSSTQPGGAVWPDHIVDVKKSIVWVKKNIERYGGDPSLIIIAGESAGAHLASLAAVTPNLESFQPGFEFENTSVQGCVEMYGISDFADTHGQWKAHDSKLGLRHPNPEKPSLFINFIQKCVMKSKITEDADAFLQASPVHHAKMQELDIPFLLGHGDRDILVPVHESVALARALDSKNVTFLEVPGGHHGFNCFPCPRAFLFFDVLTAWLNEVVREYRGRNYVLEK